MYPLTEECPNLWTTTVDDNMIKLVTRIILVIMIKVYPDACCGLCYTVYQTMGIQQQAWFPWCWHTLCVWTGVWIAPCLAFVAPLWLRTLGPFHMSCLGFLTAWPLNFKIVFKCKSRNHRSLRAQPPNFAIVISTTFYKIKAGTA